MKRKEVKFFEGGEEYSLVLFLSKQQIRRARDRAHRNQEVSVHDAKIFNLTEFRKKRD